MSIKVLAPAVAAKIAAGEVVERPANVAKELLENSLDAGATEVKVEIREGGQRLLRIMDNGHGIHEEEIALAFQRHATSKLISVDDLEQIGTFGFRGEALYSIAAVSQLTLTSRHETEEFGAQMRLEGGEIVRHSKAGTSVGTIVAVENLFFNMPARRKFLKRPVTEAGHISAVVQRYALANPATRFSFINDGRLVFQSSGSGDLYDVLVKVHGLEKAKQMVPVGDVRSMMRVGQDNSCDGGLADDVDFMEDSSFSGTAEATAQATSQPNIQQASSTPLNVYGYTSLPTLTHANRSKIDLFVNSRYVEDRNLTHAIVQAYHTLLPVGRSPLAVMFIDIDPRELDVNVHPQKTQVRFVQERKVFSAMQKAVRQAVVGRAPVPSMGVDASGAILPTSKLGETGEQDERSLEGWAARRERILNAGNEAANPQLDLFAAKTPTAVPPAQPSVQPSAPVMDAPGNIPEPPAWLQDAGAYMPDEYIPSNAPDNAEPYPSQSYPSQSYPSQSYPSQEEPPTTPPLPAPEQDVYQQAAPQQPVQRPTQSPAQQPPPIQAPLHDPPPAQPQSTTQSPQQQPVVEKTSQLPPLRVVGQAGTMYIVAEGPSGLYLIDQHAAHERILYEKFLAQRYGLRQDMGHAESDVPKQHLLQPLTLHMGSELAGLVAQYLSELQEVGFEIEPFGGDTYLVRAVPSVLSGQDPQRNLEEIVQGISEGRNLVGQAIEDRMVKMICKRASIKAGQQLSDIEMQELVRQLEDCQSPRTCPHGRPTMIQLSSGELEKAFGRI